MSPIAATRGDRGGSTIGSHALGAVKRGHRPDTKEGLDGSCARRRHQGRSTTKHSKGRVESGAAGVWAYFFSCKKKKLLNIEVVITLL
jgi:hypothetical protein